jgi:hypothetical protein
MYSRHEVFTPKLAEPFFGPTPDQGGSKIPSKHSKLAWMRIPITDGENLQHGNWFCQ